MNRIRKIIYYAGMLIGVFLMWLQGKLFKGRIGCVLAVLLIPSICLGANLDKWNGVTVGTSSGNISKWNGVTIGTSAGNIGAINGLTASGAASPCTGANPSDCTFRETFNGSDECATGYTSNCSAGVDAWTVVTGTPDFDNTSYPMSGQTYAMYLNGTGITVRNTTNFGAADEYYAATSVHVETLGSITGLMYFKNSTTGLCYMSVDSGGQVTVKAEGGTISTTIATISTGRSYVKMRYKKGTGSNAECEGWVSSNGTSWGTSKSSTDGTGTAQANRLYMVGGATPKIHPGEVRVYTGNISW